MRRIALLIVRNPFTHDARVLRAAAVLHDLGYQPSVLAVMSTSVRTRREVVQGVPVLRLDPASPFAWLRGKLPDRRDRADGGRSGPAEADPWMRPLIRLHRWARTVDFYRRAFGVVLRERPALIHCNDYNTMWIGVAARAFTGATVVYDAHELWPDRNGRPEPRWWLLAWEAVFVRVAHHVVTASPGFADSMARRYRIPRPTVVLNIPATTAPNVVREPGREPIVVYVGALAPHRGIEQSVAALAQVPDARLRLIGPGHRAYVDGITALARRLGVLERVEVAASVPPDGVVDAIGDADLGLSLFQPMCMSHVLVAPNKLFEYVAAKVPVLASDLPVIRSFVDRWGFGMTVAPSDTQAIARCMTELLDPATNRRLRLAATTAASQLNWENERRRLVSAYQSAVRAPS